jgi:hypothetical protein
LSGRRCSGSGGALPRQCFLRPPIHVIDSPRDQAHERAGRA